MPVKTTRHTQVRCVPGGVWMRFYDYPSGSLSMRREHRLWIDQDVAPFLLENPLRSVFMAGITSSAGGVAEDERLALRRVQALCAYLRGKGVSESQFEQGFGPFRAVTEEPAVDDALRKDNPARAALMAKPGYYRAVEVWLIKHNVTRMAPENGQLAQRHAEERTAANQ